MNSARSWVVFGGAVFAYIVGVTQRTSFGVLGVDATERFHVTAAASPRSPWCRSSSTPCCRSRSACSPIASARVR